MNAYDQIRYALIEAKGWLIECLNKDNPPTEDGINEAIDRVDAVLALPRRNCDVGTAEEQSKRFIKYCGSRCMAKCRVYEKGIALGIVNRYNYYNANCRFIWAQMPYESQEGAVE